MSEQLFDQLGKGKDEHSRENIGNAMDNIERQSRRYPYERLLKVKAVHKSLSGSVKHTKRKSVERANDRIYYHCGYTRHIFRQKHSHPPQNRPNVKIRHPPRSKSGIETLYYNVKIEWNQCFFAKIKSWPSFN